MTTDALYVAHSTFFQDKMVGPIPDPPVFSSPNLKFTVPPYFAFRHAESQWLVNMVRSNSWDRIWRVALSNPDYFTHTYIQFPDCPDKGMGTPMFHRRAVLYLTPLGLAVYMNRHVLVKRILEFKTDDDLPLVTPNQPLYAANVYERDPSCSDLQVIFPFCVLFRRESYECIKHLLRAGWNAHSGFVLPYRRTYRMFSFEYKDFLDYCIAQMAARPNLRLPTLIYSMITALSDNFSLLEFEKVDCLYAQKQFEDWVSIPRRMLRFVFYFDRDLRIACQVIRCIKVIQKCYFFSGPCKSAFEINYSHRKTVSNVNSRMEKVIFDQDNCISLMLGIFYRAVGLRHTQTQEKLLEVLLLILVHTHWITHFLCTNPQTLVDHFGDMIENVKPIKLYVIELIKKNAIHRIKNNYYHVTILIEIKPKSLTTSDWDRAINEFILENTNKMGTGKNLSIKNSGHKNSSNESSTNQRNEMSVKITKSFTKNNSSHIIV